MTPTQLEPTEAGGRALSATQAPRIPLWVDLRAVPINKRLPFFSAMRQAGVERVLFAKGDDHLVRDGLSALAIDGKGRILEGKSAIGRVLVVENAKQQAKAAKEDGIVVVEGAPQRILPLENLIAARQDRPGTLFARAATPAQADLCATILERGVHGILLAPATATDIVAADALLRKRYRPHVQPGPSSPPADANVAAPASAPSSVSSSAPASAPSLALSSAPSSTTQPGTGIELASIVPAPGDVTLHEATITAVTDAGPGDRVCVDTTSLLSEGEGLLVGSCAHSLALVLAETAANPVVKARPFRINAGALHSYCLVPGNRTAYLAELQAGSQVLAAGPNGTRTVTVGRVKVENRPHRILHWDTPRGPASIALQLAETVRLAGTAQPIPVTDVKSGMRILVHDPAATARHGGVAVDERVEER